jgi:hypothetical protein
MAREDSATTGRVAAPERASPSRVLTDAVDLWISAPSHEKSEVRTFCDLVAGLLDDADPDRRRYVAERLAKRADISPALARRLASDDPPIAAPMIVGSPVLTSADLVQIMRCGPAHVRLVAERLDLGAEITASLVGPLGAAEALRRAAAGARVTSPGTTSRPSDSAAREAAEPHPTITPPSADAEPSIAAETAPTAEPRARRRTPLGDRGTDDRDLSLATFLALEPAGRWRAIRDAASAVALQTTRPRARPAGEAIGPRLFRPLAHGDRAGFIEELATVLRIGDAAAEKILDDPHGEPLAVALAALGVDERTATSILLLGLGERATLGQMQDLSALAARIGWRTGEQVVTGWRGGPANRTETIRQVDPAERRDGRREPAPRVETRDVPARRSGGRGTTE